MKIIKYLIAFVLTILMLYVARTNSRGQSEFITHTENGYTFEYHTVPKGLELETKSIAVTVEGDFSSGEQVLLHHNNENKQSEENISNHDIKKPLKKLISNDINHVGD